jgi:hypothetical protein
MGDAMNPLNPNQLLRILENGYFMTHQEQSEAAAYIRQLQAELAKSKQQASTEPPDYVEPPTSDYHNGWEEGFEAAKNLYPKKTKREWVGLTDEDTANICMQGDLNDWHDEQVIDAVQAKLKEKNGG